MSLVYLEASINNYYGCQFMLTRYFKQNIINFGPRLFLINHKTTWTYGCNHCDIRYKLVINQGKHVYDNLVIILLCMTLFLVKGSSKNLRSNSICFDLFLSGQGWNKTKFKEVGAFWQIRIWALDEKLFTGFKYST